MVRAHLYHVNRIRSVSFPAGSMRPGAGLPGVLITRLKSTAGVREKRCLRAGSRRVSRVSRNRESQMRFLNGIHDDWGLGIDDCRLTIDEWGSRFQFSEFRVQISEFGFQASVIRRLRRFLRERSGLPASSSLMRESALAAGRPESLGLGRRRGFQSHAGRRFGCQRPRAGRATVTCGRHTRRSAGRSKQGRRDRGVWRRVR